MFAVFNDLVVQVRCFRSTSTSYFADEIAALHVLTGAHIVGRKVSVESYIAITVVDADVIAIALGVAIGTDYHAIASSIYRSALRCSEVHTIMELTGFGKRVGAPTIA